MLDVPGRRLTAITMASWTMLIFVISPADGPPTAQHPLMKSQMRTAALGNNMTMMVTPF